MRKPKGSLSAVVVALQRYTVTEGEPLASLIREALAHLEELEREVRRERGRNQELAVQLQTKATSAQKQPRPRGGAMVRQLGEAAQAIEIARLQAKLKK